MEAIRVVDGQSRRPVISTKALGAAVAAACGGFATVGVGAAVASNPLYCTGYHYQSGCGRNYTAPNRTNSARNENGGSVFIQARYIGGWGARHYGANGAVVTSHLRSPAKQSLGSHPFGECIQAGTINLAQSIHCRYSSTYPA
jgi:hypothetical protein